MFPLCTDSSVSEKGEASSGVCFLGSLIKDKFIKLNFWKKNLLFGSQTLLPIKGKLRALGHLNKTRFAEIKFLTRFLGCPRHLLCSDTRPFFLWPFFRDFYLVGTEDIRMHIHTLVSALKRETPVHTHCCSLLREETFRIL